ncbi:MAG: hypothetical protein M3044_15395 [Thermoproteota archaeon]|nr:hypothetical protein [Thermoproteota archaeon]
MAAKALNTILIIFNIGAYPRFKFSKRRKGHAIHDGHVTINDRKRGTD